MPRGGPFDIIVCSLKQAEDDILHIFTHIAGFSQEVASAMVKGTFRHARQSLRKQGLAGTRGPDAAEYCFSAVQPHPALLPVDPFVVVVDGNREDLFGPSWPIT